MATVVPGKKTGQFGEALGQGLANLITSGSQAYMNRADESAIQNAIMGLGEKPTARQIIDAITSTKTYNPTAKQQTINNILGVERVEELKRHAQAQENVAQERNRISALGKQTPEDRKQSYDNYIARGYDEDEAQAMVNPYVTPGDKQNISRRVEDEIARKIRQPNKPQETGIVATVEQIAPTAPGEQNQAPQGQETPTPVEEAQVPAVAAQPAPEVKPPAKQEEWPKLPEPQGLKPNELGKWRSDNQKFNSKELKDLRQRNQANTDAMIHYSRLTQLNDTGKVQDGLSRVLIDPDTGEPYKNVQKIAGVNKETQQYIKTLNDFISQAKNFFGARVTNFDLSSFKARLPSLLNTEEGRRAIIEQMRLLTELQSAHDKELSEGIKRNGDKSYIDIVKSADDRVSSKEQTIISKINHLDTATKFLDMMASNPKYKGMEMMFNPETNDFVAVRPGDKEAVKKRGYEAWRTPL